MHYREQGNTQSIDLSAKRFNSLNMHLMNWQCRYVAGSGNPQQRINDTAATKSLEYKRFPHYYP